MSSTFFGLNIGYTGLISAEAKLTVTGNNIANVETEGYSRQTTRQTAAKALRTNTRYGMAGAGVETVSIDQVRNQFYDLKYWNNNANLGIYEIKAQYNRQIEDLFADTDSVQGFNVVFNDMSDALVEVSKNAGDDSVKNQYIAACGNLVEYFNYMYTSLQKLQEDANNEVQNKVAEVNTIAEEIATLNKQINMIEVNGIVANELRDKRSLLIDQLSTIVDVEVEEIPVKRTEEDNAEDAGIYRYVVNIAGGQNLINGYDYSVLECTPRDYKVNQSDAKGLFDISINGITLNLYGGQLGGSLKGLIEVRDGNNGENFSAKGNFVNVSDAGKTVTVKIDSSNTNYSALSNIDKSTLDDSGVFILGGKEFRYDSWVYNTETNEYTFKLSDYYNGSPQNASSYNHKDIAIGTDIDYQGIPYYMAQMNEWCRLYAKAVNETEMNAQDGYNEQAEAIFTRGTNNYRYTDEDIEGTYYREGEGYYKLNADGTYAKNADGTFVTNTLIYSGANNYHQLTAETIRVNKNMVSDISKFGTTTDNTQGQDAHDVVDELITIKTDKSKVKFRGRTAQEFLQCLTSDVALNASSANSFYKNYQTIEGSIQNQRLSVSGVDNDEESLNLVKFQEAFNLASKMISVMVEMYDQLILRTGV